MWLSSVPDCPLSETPWLGKPGPNCKMLELARPPGQGLGPWRQGGQASGFQVAGSHLQLASCRPGGLDFTEQPHCAALLGASCRLWARSTSVTRLCTQTQVYTLVCAHIACVWVPPCVLTCVTLASTPIHGLYMHRSCLGIHAHMPDIHTHSLCAASPTPIIPVSNAGINPPQCGPPLLLLPWQDHRAHKRRCCVSHSVKRGGLSPCWWGGAWPPWHHMALPGLQARPRVRLLGAWLDGAGSGGSGR